MANRKTSQLETATALDGTETLYVVQGGASKQTDVGTSLATLKALSAGAATNLAAVSAVTPGATGLALLADASAPDALTTLGVSAFAQTLLDDATADATLDTLGFGAAGKAIAADATVADVRDYLDIAPYVATRTALKALDTTKDTVVVLTEQYREGRFIWNGSDVAAILTPSLGATTTVDSATDTATKTGHQLYTGDAFFITTTVDGLTANTIYYAIRIDADNFQVATTHANAYAGTAIDLTGTTNFTFKRHLDPMEGVYVIPTGKTFDGSQGAFVRVLPVAGLHLIDWFGARGAVDILPIFNAAKWIAAGGTLLFGAATYATSDTLYYEGISRKPLTITGVSETDSIIQMSGTGFVIKYYGEQGAAKEVRGGGVFNLKLEKIGGGSCNGVSMANVFRGRIMHINTTSCGRGSTGVHLTARGGGDQDACQECEIAYNRLWSGLIGVQIRGDTSGSIVAARCNIHHNQLDDNEQTGIWIANCDEMMFADNAITVCGDGRTGVNKRGNIFIEVHGVTCRNIFVMRNEIGNNITGAVQSIIIDGLQGGIFQHNRHVRNTGEFGTAGFLLGFSATAAVISNIDFIHEFFNVADAAGYLAWNAGGSNKTYAGNVIRNPIYNQYAPASKYGAMSNFVEIYEAGVPTLRVLSGSNTTNPASVAVGGSQAYTVVVIGAALGDFVVPSFSLDLTGLTLTAYVSSASIVTCVFSNNTAGAVDLASGTLSARVFKT